MSTTTTITLPDDIFNELQLRAPQPEARANLVTEALRSFFSGHRSDEAELALLNQHADELNREALDVLEYQVIP